MKVLFANIILFLSFTTSAEPWLATRFAQNCAACHSPSRYNVKAEKRRCTLSCQGCHTNPNGGGLRNFYGKWTSNRWLNSGYFKVGKNKEKPLPWFAQGYTSQTHANKMKKALQEKRKTNTKTLPQNLKTRKQLATAIRKTAQLREISQKKTFTESDFKKMSFEEFYYERANGDTNWESIVESSKKFESVIPFNDPYMFKRTKKINVGVDFRYLAHMPLTKSSNNKKIETDLDLWPMVFDVGLEYRPLPAHSKFYKIAFVSETRYANGPNTKEPEHQFQSAKAKSAYVLIDDLPFNSFIMHGLYKPMFEHYTPDHETLAQSMFYRSALSTSPFSATFKTISIGSAPNVPFINVHFVQPSQGPFMQERGFITNLGARWVTLGASFVYSFWNTANQSTKKNLTTLAHSIQGGMKWQGFILNFEMLRLEQEFTQDAFNKGSVFTLELRYRIWKENYIEFIAERADTALSLNEGRANQNSLGYRTFIFPGVDFSAFYREMTNYDKHEHTTHKQSSLILQTHLYF